MKTRAVVQEDIYQTEFKKGDTGFIDGYVQAADSRPYAVFVRDSDGVIDLALPYQIRAVSRDEGPAWQGVDMADGKDEHAEYKLTDGQWQQLAIPAHAKVLREQLKDVLCQHGKHPMACAACWESGAGEGKDNG